MDFNYLATLIEIYIYVSGSSIILAAIVILYRFIKSQIRQIKYRATLPDIYDVDHETKMLRSDVNGLYDEIRRLETMIKPKPKSKKV